MKKGWQKTARLGDLFMTAAGGTPLTTKREYYEGGTIPWLNSGEVRQGVVHSARTFITELGLRNSNAKIFPKDTVLVALYGATAAQVGILAIEAATNQAVFGIYPNSSFLPKFIFYFLLSCHQELSDQAVGSAQPNLSGLKVKDLQVPLAPLPEQQRIVGVLDEAFASLATAQAHAAQNLQNARALFESCIQVEFGKDVALGELVDIKTGKLDANAAEEDGEYPFFTCSRETYAINNYAFDCEAVLLAGNNAVGDFNVKHYVGKFNAYQRTYVITINSRKRAISRYLYYQLQKNLAKFKSQSVGTGTKFLKLGMIKDMMIPLPTIPEQSRIVNQFDALAAETQRLAQIYEQKLAALAALKKSLLHQAFSGEL
jgi:type I restriction enzyme S subunit